MLLQVSAVHPGVGHYHGGLGGFRGGEVGFMTVRRFQLKESWKKLLALRQFVRDLSFTEENFTSTPKIRSFFRNRVYFFY